MANLKSTLITNRDASPQTLNSPGIGAAALLKSTFGQAALSTSEDAGHIIRLVEVPSNANVKSVRFWGTAMTSGAVDIGVYRNTRDGGAVVDADFFASALVVSSAISGTEQSHESTVYTLAKREQPLWQAVGLSADPGTTFDIALTVTTDIGASGNAGIVVDYCS